MNKKVDILLLGSGGREHALLAKLAESPRAGKLYVAPGNGGMDVMAEKVEGLDAESPVAVAEWARAHSIGLVVIGPEAPLVAGVADAVRSAGIACFGPNGDAAQMEGSKKFAKQVMSRAGVPTAAYRSFTDEESCADYVRREGAPIVIKADGLAAGKGVIVAKTTEEALAGVHECFSGAFGEAGATVVVEETLDGPECSLLALTDGKTVVPLATAQDHKRALDGDKGPNTGGMGVYSPVPEHLVSAEQLAARVEVERKPVEAVDELMLCEIEGRQYGAAASEAVAKPDELPARYADAERMIIGIDSEIRRLQQTYDELKDGLRREMEKAGVKRWKSDRLQLILKEDTTRESFDTKAFREACPDIYGQFLKYTAVKGGLTIKVAQTD